LPRGPLLWFKCPPVRHRVLVGGQRDKRVNSDFHRIRRLPPYVFEQVNKLKAQARARGDDIIDFGMGNPDMPTPPHIVQKLIETVRDTRTSRYSASRGIQGLRRAQGAYYARRFGVKLNPETEIVATLGSKEGFANMAQAITGPGDVILVPNPTYPIHEFGFIMSGGVIRHLPASTDSAFMNSLSRAVRHSVPKPSALVLNYPANPTALVAGLDFYREVVGFAKKHDLISLMPKSISETSRRRRSFRCLAPWTSRWSSPRCPRPTPCPAGAWVLPSATSG
jgi:alanine-synthesizing transaminase